MQWTHKQFIIILAKAQVINTLLYFLFVIYCFILISRKSVIQIRTQHISYVNDSSKRNQKLAFNFESNKMLYFLSSKQ